MNGSLYHALLTEIQKMPVIDTHEHLWWDEAEFHKAYPDVLRTYLEQYLKSDLISAGLKPGDFTKVIDPDLPITARWKIAEPYWEASRYTGYGRALDIAVKGIYGIDGIRGETIEALSDAYQQANKPGHCRHVLRDLCNIETSLVDVWTFRLSGENELYKRIWQPINFVQPTLPEGDRLIAQLPERTLDGWLALCETELDEMLSLYGVRVLKVALAYERTLRFEEVSYATAKALFADALSAWDASGRRDLPEFPQPLQDYMMHHILSLANTRNLTIQFHTGILEGNGNTLSNSDPSHLNNLFLKYPDVDFDLFHISYPYQGIACALAKMFPNVTINMCWAHILSPSACISALSDFLDAIPSNKISAFGGDYVFPDGVYGHLYLARENVARTLAGKVERGAFSEDTALRIAKALFYDNPKRIFQL